MKRIFYITDKFTEDDWKEVAVIREDFRAWSSEELIRSGLLILEKCVAVKRLDFIPEFTNRLKACDTSDQKLLVLAIFTVLLGNYSPLGIKRRTKRW